MEEAVRVTIDISKNLADVLSITCIGMETLHTGVSTHVCTRAIKLEDGLYLKVGKNGEVTQHKV